MYDDPIYNCFIHTATVIDCPPATVSATDPDGGWEGQVLNDMSITGSFIEGPSLAVKLAMTGESDIVATDVTFVSDTEITCDIDLAGAAAGDWDVVVANGCGTEGSCSGCFEVKECGALTCPSTSPTTMIGSNRLYYWPPQPVRSTNTRVMACYSTGYYMCTINVTGTSVYDLANNNPTYTIYETCVTSDDKLIYQDSGQSNGLQTAQYTGSGWSGIRTSFGPALPSGYYVYRLTIDADDNPIVLARSSSATLHVFHWNGTDWGSAINVPSSIVSEYGSYSYVQDFAYDSGTGYYYLTERYSNHGVHCWDGDGNLVWQDTNIWSPGPTSTSWETGIFIDYSDPDCRLICMSGYNSSNQTTYWARYNNAGGGKTTGTTTGGTYGTTFSTFQGEGCIQIVGTTAYFLASTYGGNVWSSTIVPSW
jgi:hypothetical protein